MSELLQVGEANDLLQKAQLAKTAAAIMAKTTTAEKNEALQLISAQLLEEQAFILGENEKDVAAGRAGGMSESLIDRLKLDEGRLTDIAKALVLLIELEDPVGEVLEQWERPNGLAMSKIRVPLGVIGMIYEARPNVTVDASSLCLKTGNAVVLRGSSTAIHSNKALVQVIHNALQKSALPEEAVQLIEDTRRETAAQMFKLNSHLDVLIPRGGAKLIQTVVQNASVPVLETGAGNCHVYIDETADVEMALAIALNAKTQRPSVCNACESILVHEEWAKNHLGKLIEALQKQTVQIHGDETVQQYGEVIPASEEDWGTEYLGLEVAVKVVDSVDEAIAHINVYGTKHSEAFCFRNA